MGSLNEIVESGTSYVGGKKMQMPDLVNGTKQPCCDSIA
jgi:hypothetical protein